MTTLNRTLAQLRRARARGYPAMYEYAPDTSAVPDGLRFMTLAEAEALECNRCGQCCGSDEADLEGLPLGQYAFGAIPRHQWRALNGGEPLIIPLAPSGRDRAWRASDANAVPHPPFRCAALAHEADGTTRCTLWASERPSQCDEFPVRTPEDRADVADGVYVLLATTYQRLCTWVDVLVCPDDSVLLGWRRRDGTMPRRLAGTRRAYVARVLAEAYRDAYPGAGGALPVEGWQQLRASEAALR